MSIKFLPIQPVHKAANIDEMQKLLGEALNGECDVSPEAYKAWLARARQFFYVVQVPPLRS
jgi:hypothetical protein